MFLPAKILLTAFLALLCLNEIAPAGESDPDVLAEDARRLLKEDRYAESLALWMRLIDDSGAHPSVTEGDAHWYASRCLRYLGEPKNAAGLLESYLKRFPRGKGGFAANLGIFYSYDEAGEEKPARKAGKRVFAGWPEANGTFTVLRMWVERGWKVPRLKTPFKTLYDWTFKRIEGTRDPELRLAFLDILSTQHRNEGFVTDGAILYCQAWAHIQAGRPEEGLALGEKHLKLYPKDVNRDKMRVLMARALLDLSPPMTKRARKLLRAVVANAGPKYRKQAEELLGVEPRDRSIQIEKGCPKPEGLSKIVVLTNLSSGSDWFRAAAKWRKARSAEVVQFRGSDPKAAMGSLRRIGPEFVAVHVKPETIDNNFHLGVLELCRGLDRDPMPDFHFGYLTARNPKDLEAFLAGILEKEARGGTSGDVVAVQGPGGRLASLDFLLHYGHGTPRRVVGGLDAAGVAALALENGPVVFSGACFNGVCGLSFESSVRDYTFHTPRMLRPEEVISLAWIHAGATGLFAALDGDRGEMAMAEWEYFREHAASLGEVIGHTYRSVFTSLKEDYGDFPRYRAGQPRRTYFFDVMLRGWTSRILISDPMYRPLKRPLTGPTARASARRSGDAIVVEVESVRFVSGPFINILPRLAGTPFREKRLYARVALPEGFTGRLGRPKVALSGKAAGVDLSRRLVRHEVWGGRRYVTVQAESASGKLVTAGAKTTWTFPIR